MNCVELFVSRANDHGDRPALWLPGGGITSFNELLLLAARGQQGLRRHGVGTKSTVLVVESLGPALYAAVLAILGMGATVILVEPWMPVGHINRVVGLIQPQLFVTNTLGRLWGLRVPSIRQIPNVVGARGLFSMNSNSFHTESVPEDTPAIITFTSGTTGAPKGVVRQQGYLIHQFETLSRVLRLDEHRGPDLCIFANFVLANLAAGRCSCLVPGNWKPSALRKIDELAGTLTPESLTCGPAFLMELMAHTRLPSLQSIHVGGALTDCWILEQAFEKWPGAHWTHVYGSSEAEPVSTVDAKKAVELSRERNLFQTLSLGRPVPEIQPCIEDKGLWVSGQHVCPQYLGNDEENRLNKRKDASGRVWHFMGDRVIQDESGWWYSGRSQQEPNDFDLEQRVYQYLQSSASFVHRAKNGCRYLVGKKLKRRTKDLSKTFAEIDRYEEIPIYRDRRHRARIDRTTSLKKGAPWLVG